MKVKGKCIPNPYDIINLEDGTYKVVLNDNCINIPDEEVERFSFDRYEFIVRNADKQSLHELIEVNYNKLIEMLKDKYI